MEVSCPSNWPYLKERVRSPKAALRCRFRFAHYRTGTYFGNKEPSASAFSVRRIRRQAAGCLVRLPLRLRLAPIAAGRTDPRLAGGNRCKRRDIRRPCNPDPAGSLYRIRRGGWHRLALRQAAFRGDIWPIAGIRLQVSIPQTRRQDMRSLHDRCRSPVAVHEDRRVATRYGNTAFPPSGRRGTQLHSHYEERTWRWNA
jgi:hypothetical protein